MQNYDKSLFHLTLIEASQPDWMVFSFQATLRFNRPNTMILFICVVIPINPDNFLGKSIRFSFANQKLQGVITNILYEHYTDQGHFYRLKIASLLLFPNHTKKHRIFINKNISEILLTLLTENGLRRENVIFLGDLYKQDQKNSITQYQETDYQFFQRLINKSGLYYRIHSTPQEEQLLITNQLDKPAMSPSKKISRAEILSLKEIHSILHQISLTTTRTDFSLNDLITLENSPLPHLQSKLWRVIGLQFAGNEHLISRSIQHHLLTTVLLKPLTEALSHKQFDYSYREPGLQSAHLYGKNVPLPDEYDRYRVIYHTAQIKHQQSALLPKTQTFTGPGYGQHFPLYPATEVITMNQNSTLDHAVILGTLTNEYATDPITSKNRMTHVIRSYAQHELVFNDQANYQRIQCQTGDTTQQLRFKNNDIHSLITLQNKIGTLTLKTSQKLYLKTQGNFEQSIQKQHILKIQKNIYFKTEKGGLIWHALHLIQCTAEETFLMQTQQSIEIQTLKQIHFCTHHHLTLTALQFFHHSTKTLHLEAGQQLRINGSLHIQTGQSRLHVTKTKLTLSGTHIHIIGKP